MLDDRIFSIAQGCVYGVQVHPGVFVVAYGRRYLDLGDVIYFLYKPQ
jgi:hypothetical protein